MNITALLSFYDENPAWLERCVTSLPMIGVSALVAVDGAYSLYPDARPRSPDVQRHTLIEAARKAGVSLTTFTPHEPWPGEVEKRNHMFEMAERTGAHWYFVIDADEFITEAPDDLHQRLRQAAMFDVGAVTLKEPGHPLGTIVYPTHPKFFRAVPGLRAVGDHFTYTTPDGRRLWGDQKRHRIEARADLTAVIVEHHNQLRHPDRRKAALEYYDTRDALGVEDLPADRPLLKDPA